MQLFYREKGNSSYPPLILLHGLWGASDNWLGVANQLATHFHVLLPDFRNHGHSPHDDVHDYSALSEDITDFIGSLNLPTPPFIAGHSMGGKALMLLLLKRPEIVQKAAIIDICPRNYEVNNFHQELFGKLARFSLRHYTSRQELHVRLREEFSSEELCQIALKNIQKTSSGFEWRINLKAICNNLFQLMSWPPTGNTTYSKPILFIKGEYSDYISPHDLPAIYTLFPAAELYTLPSDHQIHIRQPQLLARTLDHFFSDSIPSDTF